MSQSKKNQTRHLSLPNPNILQDRREEDEAIVPWVIEFRVVGTTDLLRARMAEEFTIGRGDAELGHFPQIDLTPYAAHELGVSRRHVRIYTRDNRVLIEDLRSANGTFINNEMLIANKPYRLRDKDKLRLGELELQVHYVVKPLSADETRTGWEQAFNIPSCGRGRRLLLVDEDKDVLRLLKFVARQAGFEVVTAENLSQAMASFDAVRPDVILCEMLLPDGNGESLIRYVRGFAKELPIAVLTSATAGYTMGQALESGADMFLAKPLALDEYVSALVKLAELAQ